MATLTRLDRFIERMSPKWGMSRARDRKSTEIIRTSSVRLASYRSEHTDRMQRRADASYAMTGLLPLGTGLDPMRNQSRRLDRDNALGASLLDRNADLQVGEGSSIQFMSEDQEWAKETGKRFRDWWETADVTGRMTGPELERIIVRTRNRDGDIGIVMLANGKIRAVEGDFINTPSGQRQPNTGSIVDGVQLAGNGRAVRYFVQNTPGNSAKFDTVEARNMVLFARRKSVTQVRGEPVYAQTFQLFDHLENYIEAAVTAAEMAACLGLLWHADNAKQVLGGLETGDDAQGNDRPLFDLEPGMQGWMPPGASDVTQIDPKQPQQQFPDFVAAIIRQIALPFGLPIELALMDFSRVNYSSARAAIIQTFTHIRAERIPHYAGMSRIARWWVSRSIKAGDFNAPSDGDAWRMRWVPRPMQLLDPEKELQGKRMKLDFGMGLLADELALEGMTVEQYADRRGKEEDTLAEAGIVTSRSTRSRDANTDSEEPDDDEI